MQIFQDTEYEKELLKLFFEKGFLSLAILITGYLITKSIERIKSNEAFKNEITKIRVERIAHFYDLISKYEHWINRLAIHQQYQVKNNALYLTESEFQEAINHAHDISKIIGFELNKMRFWINDDIYFHTVAQLELMKKLNSETLLNTNVENIEKLRFENDAIRMNIDKLLPYLKSKQDLKLIKYDRSFLYKKS